MSSKRLIVALDFKNFDEMSEFVARLDPNSCVVKVGQLSQRMNLDLNVLQILTFHQNF